MKTIDDSINFKKETLYIANNLGFETYTEAISELYLSGRSPAYIAGLFERSENSIYTGLKKIGVQMRQRGGNRIWKK